MDVLLLTNADDLETALPGLTSFVHSVLRAPLTDHGDGHRDGADIAIVDAHSDPTTARALCRRMTANTPAIAVMAVVTPGGVTAVDIDWHLDDVMLPATGADELLERLRLAIGRRHSAINSTLKFGDPLLRPGSFTGSLDGEHLDLTLTEFKLLNFLVQHAGRAFTRTRPMHEVWGFDCNGRSRTVDVHVRRLRAKLGARQSLIDTVRGVGYMVAAPPRPEWIVSALAATSADSALR